MAREPGQFDDDLDALRKLGRDCEALSVRLAGGEQALTDSSAEDPTGAVRVVLGADGRIAAVALIPDWRSRLHPDGLGSAVLSAQEEAARNRCQAWAEAVRDAPSEDAGTSNDAENVHDSRRTESEADAAAGPTVTPDPTDAGAVEFGRRLFYVLQDVSAGLEDLVFDATRRAQHAVTAQGPDGTVTVVLTGGVVTAVSTIERWLRSAPHDEIGRAITAAVQAGYAAVDEETASSLRNRWPFDELDRLSADPMRLLSNLGLPMPRPRQGNG